MKHEVRQDLSPTHVVLRCSCGWAANVHRNQKSTMRASKVRMLRDTHLSQQEKSMTTYTVGDDHIQAANARELVQKMHALSRSPAENDKAWMAEVAERISMQSGKKIRSSTSDAFVTDLISVGFIKTEN